MEEIAKLVLPAFVAHLCSLREKDFKTWSTQDYDEISDMAIAQAKSLERKLKQERDFKFNDLTQDFPIVLNT